MSTDKFEGRFAHQSPYVFAGNMPVLAIDIQGDSVWVTTVRTYDADRQKAVVVNTVHVSGKILDLSGFTTGSAGCSTPTDGVPALVSMFEEEINSLSASIDIMGHDVTWKFDVNFEIAKSMKEVKPSDHLIVIVDEVIYDESTFGGGNTVGVAKMPGKVAYVENRGGYNMAKMVKTMIHELGHNLGLDHKFEDKNNYMSYGKNKRSKFDYAQFKQIFKSMDASNNGRNWSKAFETDNNTLWHTSTEQEPYDMDVKKGEKTPLRIYD